MTTDEDTTVTRRSQRIQKLQSSQAVQYDDQIDNSEYEGAVSQEEEDDDEDNNDDPDDPDVRPGSSSRPRKRKTKRAPKGTNKRAKKSRTSGGKANGTGNYNELREKFEEHYLFQALNDSESSTVELAVEWVDQYIENKDLAKKDLINFLLNTVGCFTTIEEHDVNNNESASDTVGEIQTFFKRQKIHEFFLLSKKPEYKHLKKNFVEFTQQIIITSDEKGVLYENIVLDNEEEEDDETDSDGSNIMEDLLVWLSALSVSSVRALRYVSSLSLFSIESIICKTIKKNNTSLENFKRQLENEQKKKQTATIKKRIEQIEKNVGTFNKQSLILDSFTQDIVNTTFIHRFKDTDHLIRSEAMSSLGEWMDLYPEFFFKVMYLKYLGWVLSDSNSSVRLQVIKTLIKLLKHHSVVTGLRQFLERFKERIIEISFYDVDNNVKISAISLLTEINKSGYLEDEEVNLILSSIFQQSNKKLLTPLSNFLQVVEKEKSNELIESLDSAIESYNDNVSFDLKTILKIKSLIQILSQASTTEIGKASSALKKSKFEPSGFANFSKVIFKLHEFSGVSENLITYFLLDVNSIYSLDEDLKKTIELSSQEEFILLELIHGYLMYLNEKDDEIATKSRANKDEVTNNTSIQGVISHLPDILNKIEKNNEVKFSIFIKIFQSFKVNLFEYSTTEIHIFKSIHAVFLKYFKDNTIENLKEEYIQLFRTLSNSTKSTMITDVNATLQNLTSELIIEFNSYLKDSEFELLHPNYDEIYQDYISKLLILGMHYNIVGLSDNFKVLRDKLFAVLPDISVEDDSKFPYVFQLLISSTSWKLFHLLNSNEIYDLEKELFYIPDLISELVEILVDEGMKFSIPIKSTISSIYIDLLILLSNFFHTYETSGKDNISNVSRFKELELNSLVLSSAALESIQYIFLTKESIFANVLKIELERYDDEDVNLNSLGADLENEDADAEFRWETEKDFILFTKKLLSLKKLGLIGDKLVNRIELNVDVLGDLFKTIVQEDLQDDDYDDDDDEEIENSQAIGKGVTVQQVEESEEPEEIEDEEIPDIHMED
jgi:cohesin complex subunit SA-1/2